MPLEFEVIVAAPEMPAPLAGPENVTLAPGLYTYRSDRTKNLRGTLTVKFPA